MMFIRTWVSVLLVLVSLGASAQYESPVAYLNYMASHEEQLSRDCWDYMRAANHGRSARRLEKRRTELLKTIFEARRTTSMLKPFEKDARLRDAFVEYYNILFLVLKEDYSKIVNMEEIAEQSYDAMEAYLLAQEKAEDKLDSASHQRSDAYHDFADQHNIRIVDRESKISRKLEQGGKVSRYYNPIYLIFFKANKQDYYLMKAINENDISGIEQNRTALISVAAEGRQKLDTIKSFENDLSIVVACRKVMDFWKQEAEGKVPVLARFILKRAEFDKAKKAFEAKGSGRSNAEVDAFNKMVADLNKAGNEYNATNQELNKTRNDMLNQWQDTVSKFLSAHTPRR